jgi:hypothetical protein
VSSLKQGNEIEELLEIALLGYVAECWTLQPYVVLKVYQLTLFTILINLLPLTYVIQFSPAINSISRFTLTQAIIIHDGAVFSLYRRLARCLYMLSSQPMHAVKLCLQKLYICKLISQLFRPCMHYLIVTFRD